MSQAALSLPALFVVDGFCLELGNAVLFFVTFSEDRGGTLRADVQGRKRSHRASFCPLLGVELNEAGLARTEDGSHLAQNLQPHFWSLCGQENEGFLAYSIVCLWVCRFVLVACTWILALPLLGSEHKIS